jgi:hypothetical protein
MVSEIREMAAREQGIECGWDIAWEEARVTKKQTKSGILVWAAMH